MTAFDGCRGADDPGLSPSENTGGLSPSENNKLIAGLLDLLARALPYVEREAGEGYNRCAPGVRALCYEIRSVLAAAQE